MDENKLNLAQSGIDKEKDMWYSVFVERNALTTAQTERLFFFSADRRNSSFYSITFQYDQLSIRIIRIGEKDASVCQYNPCYNISVERWSLTVSAFLFSQYGKGVVFMST